MDVRCPNDGEMTNKRCWKCGLVRGGEQLPDDQGIVSGVDELVAFVRRCLDEDERVAWAAAAKFGFDEGPGSGRWKANLGFGPAVEDEGTSGTVVYDEGAPTEDQAVHIARWDPARVLAKVKADRLILDAAVDLQEREGRYAEDFVLALAQPYAGQDGWREEWRT